MPALALRLLVSALAGFGVGPLEPCEQQGPHFEVQEIRSSTGAVTLFYRVPWDRERPIRLEVVQGDASLWTSEVPFAFDAACVDDRGWAAGVRWTRPVSHAQVAGATRRGDGELICFDATGSIAARKFVLRDPGSGCMTSAVTVFDLQFVDGGDLLLRSNQEELGDGSYRETWAVYRAADLQRRSLAIPAEVCHRPSTPLYLPAGWAAWGTPGLEVQVVPGTALLAVRWPLPEWRQVEGGVQLRELFSVLDSSTQPIGEIALPVRPIRADIDPDFNLALPRDRRWRDFEWFRAGLPQRFSLRRGLDGAWIEARVVCNDGAWSLQVDDVR